MAILYVKSRLPKETIEQQTKLIDALESVSINLEGENKELHKHMLKRKSHCRPTGANQGL